jgi:hypothetical protein
LAILKFEVRVKRVFLRITLFLVGWICAPLVGYRFTSHNEPKQQHCCWD